MIDLQPVPPSRGADARAVLLEAFRGDPILRWCFFADRPGYDDRLVAYLEAGHEFHTGLGHPVQGAFSGRELVGVLYAMLPDVETPPEAVRKLEEALAVCGADAAERFARYNREVEAITPEGRVHTLALVGVVGAWRGNGAGTALVSWLSRLCDRDEGSAGVVLDTGRERNVGFYERLGYQVVGQVTIDDVVERVMFRPRNG